MSSQPHGLGPIVGFDLDMTLVDSAAGICATLQLALEEVGWHGNVTDEQIRGWIGWPLEATVSAIAPGADPVAAAVAYRGLYADHGVRRTTLMPGSRDALKAVRDLDGRVLVVSAKAQAGVHDVLAHVGLGDGEYSPDVVFGGLFAAEKGERLRHEHAQIYVGDHTADIEAARVAGAVAVAVSTGPVAAADLAAAGADVVLPDLSGFAEWLRGYWGQRGASRPQMSAAGTRRARTDGEAG